MDESCAVLCFACCRALHGSPRCFCLSPNLQPGTRRELGCVAVCYWACSAAPCSNLKPAAVGGPPCTERACTTALAWMLGHVRTLQRQCISCRHEQNRGKTWQRCPKCKYEAWKPDDQCNRIVCRSACGTNFCFLCGEDITAARYQHFARKHHPCYAKVLRLLSLFCAESDRCSCPGHMTRKRKTTENYFHY